MTRVWFCYDCGARCEIVDAVPTCAEHGPRWRLIWSAPCGEALIVDGERALLVRRAREPHAGTWELPGGFCDGDEHPADAARRELVEELGVRVQLLSVLGVYHDPYNGDFSHVTTFLARTDDDPTPNPDEVLEAGWFGPGAWPPDEELAPNCISRLRDWEAVLAGGPSPGLRLE